MLNKAPTFSLTHILQSENSKLYDLFVIQEF